MPRSRSRADQARWGGCCSPPWPSSSSPGGSPRSSSPQHDTAGTYPIKQTRLLSRRLTLYVCVGSCRRCGRGSSSSSSYSASSPSPSCPAPSSACGPPSSPRPSRPSPTAPVSRSCGSLPSLSRLALRLGLRGRRYVSVLDLCGVRGRGMCLVAVHRAPFSLLLSFLV